MQERGREVCAPDAEELHRLAVLPLARVVVSGGGGHVTEVQRGVVWHVWQAGGGRGATH